MMLKTKISKWLPLAVAGLGLAAWGTIDAAPVSCPAFTAGMIDAAALTMRINNSLFVDTALDDSNTPEIVCHIGGESDATLSVEVNSGSSHEPRVTGFLIDTEGRTTLEASASGLSVHQETACRKEVLRSFIWKQYCASAL